MMVEKVCFLLVN